MENSFSGFLTKKLQRVGIVKYFLSNFHLDLTKSYRLEVHISYVLDYRQHQIHLRVKNQDQT